MSVYSLIINLNFKFYASSCFVSLVSFFGGIGTVYYILMEVHIVDEELIKLCLNKKNNNEVCSEYRRLNIE